MNDAPLDPELACTPAPVAPVTLPAPAPVAAAPAPVPAHIQVELNVTAKNAAVDAAVAKTKAESAVPQLDAAVKAAPLAPAPVAPPAPAPVITAEEVEAPRELSPLERLEACERHIEELVRHLAQSFGGEFSAKKERMGV